MSNSGSGSVGSAGAGSAGSAGAGSAGAGSVGATVAVAAKGTIEHQLDGYLAKRQATLETHSRGSITGGGLGGLLVFQKTGSDSLSEVRETATARKRFERGLGVLVRFCCFDTAHAVVVVVGARRRRRRDA